MKKKQKVDMTIALMLIILGIVILVLPVCGFTNVRFVLSIVFIIYALLNFIQFISTMKAKDYEGLFTTLASTISLFVNLYLKNNTPWNLSIVLFTFIVLMSLVKFKKCDYYNDRKNEIWKARIVMLIFFVIVGLVGTINLGYGFEAQMIVVGFFFLIHGILEFFDPIIIYLMEESYEQK